MATTCEYQHKKFDLKADEYTHKKFGMHTMKRKHEDKETDIPIITAQIILERAQKDIQFEQPQVKRRQTKPLFRPWMDDDNKVTPVVNNSASKTQVLPADIITYRPNMVRQHTNKARTEKEQQRRQRNTLACLINRRNKQAEQLMLQQQYVAYQQHQAAMMEQSVRSALYLRHLQQMAIMHRQQQLFVFGHSQY